MFTKTVLGAGLLAASSLTGQASVPKEVCEPLAEWAQHAAKQRDNGFDEEIIKQIVKDMDTRRAIVEKMMINAVTLAFTHEDESPALIRYRAKSTCVNSIE